MPQQNASSRLKPLSTASLARRQMIGRILTQYAGGRVADSSAVAEAAMRTWIRAAGELALLIGQGGVRAIYARSLHVTRSSYPWLPEVEQPTQTETAFANLKVGLERREAADALEASTALLVTFTDILATLIGEAMTTHLMNSAWADPASSQAVKELEQ
ncbi:MAG: hypothetical protein ACR2HE_01265 [Casimicrobiaceae bacterium]